MIGNIIKKMRLQNEKSYEELADLLGISEDLLSQYENNIKQPDFETLQKIADYCNFKIVFVNKEKNINISKENINNN